MLHVSPVPIGVPGLSSSECSAPRQSRRSAVADPIEAVIAAHRAAYHAYQVASEPSDTYDEATEAAIAANDAYDAASIALVSTPCATRFGALTLLGHLRWWIADEAEFKDGHQPAYGIAEARAADLTLFLGDGLSAPRRAAAAR